MGPNMFGSVVRVTFANGFAMTRHQLSAIYKIWREMLNIQVKAGAM